MEKVLVSISCITFNHAPFIRQCFDSFLMQKTDFKFEILIHDDASTDGTKEIIEEYTLKYPDLFFPIYQSENQYSKGVRGMMERFNFIRARGKYIALCEGDDYWINPYKLQKQIDFLEANPNYSLVLSNVENLYEYVPEAHGYDFWKHQINANTDFDISTKNLISHAMGALTAGSVFVKDLYKSNEQLKRAIGGEVKIWMVLSKYGKIRFMHQAMAKYRRQPDSISHTKQFTNQEISLVLNRIDYFKALNDFFENKYQKQFKDKINFLLLEYIQKQRHLNKTAISISNNIVKLVLKNPSFLKMFFNWLKVKTGFSEGILNYDGGKLVVDSERGIFFLKNSYGKGGFSFIISSKEQTIPLGEHTLYNKQPIYLKMPKLQKEKEYTFDIYRLENKNQKIDSFNFIVQ